MRGRIAVGGADKVICREIGKSLLGRKNLLETRCFPTTLLRRATNPRDRVESIDSAYPGSPPSQTDAFPAPAEFGQKNPESEGV